MFWVIAVCLMLSGLSSLVYQVTWARLLGLSMGATSAAVSTVVAAFFLGLGLGSWLVTRLGRRIKNNWLAYLVLEASIGVSGFLLLPVLKNLDRLVALLPSLGSSLLVKFLVTVVLLAVPTLCMGATFPVMARVLVRGDGQLGSRISALYGFNTFGAVLGALLSGFLFIPAFGLGGAGLIACASNLTVCAVGFALRHRVALEHAQTVPPEPAPTSSVALHWRQRAALYVLMATGFVSIAVEVAWTKYLVMFVGTTIYGFSAILGAVLLGIALGSWSVKSRIDRWHRPTRKLVLGLCCLGLALLFTRSGLSQIDRAHAWLTAIDTSPSTLHLLRYLVVFLLLLPPMWLFGALFPLSLRVFTGDSRRLGERVGVGYAANTVAGILGSVVAGFWWLPELGTSHLLLWSAVLVLLLPLLFSRDFGEGETLMLLVSLLGAAGSAWLLPAPDYVRLLGQVRLDAVASRNRQHTVFLREGKTGIISVDTANGNDYKLYNNGLNESRLDRRDPYNALLMESLLGLMPYFLHEHPRSAFVVGLGGGATMRALEYTAIESLRVVELEPLMKDAIEGVFGAERAGLRDPRLELTFNDARNTLLVENQRYDIIVSQPSHPWRAGAANLFTREFFEIAKSRLGQGGIYGQWLALFRMDQLTLRAIMQSFLAVFPEALTVINPGSGDLLFFGSEQALVFRPERLLGRAGEPKVQRLLARSGVNDPVQLLQLFALSRREMLAVAADAPHSTDLNLLPEVRLAALMRDARGADAPVPVLQAGGHFDVLPYLDPRVAAAWLGRLVPQLGSSGKRPPARLALAELKKIDPAQAKELEKILEQRKRRARP